MKLTHVKNSFIALILMAAFTSCEDVVDVELSDGESQFVVDAFITDQTNPEVKLSLTQLYFDSSETEFISDAEVTITEGGNVYELVYEDGAYTYPSPIVTGPGLDYHLEIIYGDDVYEADTRSNPVPIIDSIGVEFEEELFGVAEGYFAEFFARDFAGTEDFYWARYYRNDSLQNDPGDLNVIQDGAFSGNGADGLIFIPPIRQAVNDFSRRYQPGENLKVELWSIEEDVFDYLNQVIEQTSIGGPLAIISPPTYNVASNIRHISGPDELGPVGMFSVSLVTKKEYNF